MECADYWKGYNTNGVALSGQPFCQPSSVVTFRDIAIFGHHFGPQHDNLSFLTYYLAVSEVIGRSTRFLTVIRVDWVSFIAQVTVVTPCHHYSSVTATLVRRPLRNEIYSRISGSLNSPTSRLCQCPWGWKWSRNGSCRSADEFHITGL